MQKSIVPYVIVGAALLLASRKGGAAAPTITAQPATKQPPPKKTATKPPPKKADANQPPAKKRQTPQEEAQEAKAIAEAAASAPIAAAQKRAADAARSRRIGDEWDKFQARGREFPFDVSQVDHKSNIILLAEAEYNDYRAGTLPKESYPITDWRGFSGKDEGWVIVKVNPGKWVEIDERFSVPLIDILPEGKIKAMLTKEVKEMLEKERGWGEWVGIGLTVAGIVVTIGPELLAGLGIVETAAELAAAATMARRVLIAAGLIKAATEGTGSLTAEIASDLIPTAKFGIKREFMEKLLAKLTAMQISTTLHKTLD